MLARVHQPVIQVPTPILEPFQCPDDRRDFHEIGPCPGNDINAFLLQNQ
jgi:hypothetical protein